MADPNSLRKNDNKNSQNSNFVFFWKINEKNAVFSNWYPSNFTVSGIQYNCVEQYIMFQKAKLFKVPPNSKNLVFFSAFQIEIG